MDITCTPNMRTEVLTDKLFYFGSDWVSHYGQGCRYFLKSVSSQTYPVSIGVSAVKLLGFGFSLNHGVNGLQVRRVSHQRQGDVPVRHSVDPTMIHPQMVLHISRALRRRTNASLFTISCIFSSDKCVF